MDHKRTEGREGVFLPLGKLAIHQTSQVVKYVPAKHKRYNTTLATIILAMRSEFKYRPRTTARVVRVITITKKIVTGEVQILRAWLNRLIEIRTHHEYAP